MQKPWRIGLFYPLIWLFLTLSCKAFAVEAYVGGKAYQAGDQVHYLGELYECMDGPYSSYCAYEAYGPGTMYGHYMWEDLGPYVAPDDGSGITCTVEEGYEELPTFTANTFGPGDRIQYAGDIYECTDPYGIVPSYCSYADYAPGTYYSTYFWTKVGRYSPPMVCHDADGNLCIEDPSFAGALPGFIPGVYGVGDRIQHEGYIFECIDPYGAVPSYCTYETYAPGTTYAYYFWRVVDVYEVPMVCDSSNGGNNGSDNGGNTTTNNNLSVDFSENPLIIQWWDEIYDTGKLVGPENHQFAFEIKAKPLLQATDNAVPRIVGIGDFFHLRLYNTNGSSAQILLTYKAKNASGTTMSYSFYANRIINSGDLHTFKVTWQGDYDPGYAADGARVCLFIDGVEDICKVVAGTFAYEMLDDSNIILAPEGPGVQINNWKFFGEIHSFKFSENISDL